MEFSIESVSGIDDFTIGEKEFSENEKARVYSVNGKAFLVVRKNTLEVRTDRKLSALLREKYESVMESRYFGRGGIEIVNSGQLDRSEIDDLVRLSYNLSMDKHLIEQKYNKLSQVAVYILSDQRIKEQHS